MFVDSEMAAAQGSKGLVALFKRGWNEIPEIMGSTGMALIGVALGGYGLWKYVQDDGDNRPYRLEYTVIRDDDPRAEKVKEALAKIKL